MRIRTGYSFRTAVGHLDEVMSRLIEIGEKVAPISDRLSTFGFVNWTRAADTAGLRPIYGVEIGVTAEVGAKRPVVDYWTFFAKESLVPLHKLIRDATNEPGREPSLTYKMALEAQGLIKIAGERVQLEHVPGKPKDFYVALSPSTPKGLVKRVKERKLKLIASSDNYYPREDDLEFYRVALGSRRSGTQTYARHILATEDWRAACSKLAEGPTLAAALKARSTAILACRAKLKPAILLKPDHKLTLRTMCNRGAGLKGVNLKDPIYKARLNKELRLIKEKEFEDYFYIIADMVQWAKERMIVGPARGSSCGSLVCYLLDITAIDPIPYNLLFERFIDTTRSDLPDIDLDFSDVNRQLVFDYMEEKYGEERIARLGTVTMFKPRSALKGAGAALHIPGWRTEKVLETLIVRSSGDSRAMNSLEDTLKTTENGRALLQDFPEVLISARMEGHPNNSSQHAAGIVVTENPVIETVAVDSRTKAAMCDKYDAESLNLLKIDALGLTQLSIFERTLELIGEEPVSGWLEKLPMNSEEAFAVLNKGHFAGIFQFMGGSLKSLAKQIEINHIEDIISITALARPGPMATGGANSWVKRKMGSERTEYPHKVFEPYLKETLGIVAYQEQVMQIGREVGDLSWEDVTALRKAMSKSLGKEYFDQFGDRWKAAARKKGIPRDNLDKLWDDLCAFGSWAFNRCLAGETQVKLAHAGGDLPGHMSIEDLYRKYESSPSNWIRQRNLTPILVSLFPDGRGWPQKAVKIIESGEKDCTRYDFDDGDYVTCTEDHRFIINGEWAAIRHARVGDIFWTLESDPISPKPGKGKGHAKGRKYSKPQSGFGSGKDNISWVNGAASFKKEFAESKKREPCEDCGARHKRMEAHHNDFCEGKEEPKNLSWLCPGCHKKRHYDSGRTRRWQRGMKLSSKRLISKRYVGPKMTYDIVMQDHHNFLLSGGLLTHNSHAVAYGTVSYWCCWLKAHHPLEFAAATLDAEKDAQRQIDLLRELAEEGIGYVAIDPDHSADRWAVTEGKLIGPLTNVKGIGPATVRDILDARAHGAELKPSVKKKLANARTDIDTLTPVADAIQRLHPNLEAVNIITEPSKIIEAQCGVRGEVLVLAVANKIAPRDENEPVNIARRNGRVLTGPTASLNLFIADDSDEIFCKVDRFKFEKFGRPIVENGRPGKSLYAIKGTIPPGFRMISATRVKYLGEIDDGY